MLANKVQCPLGNECIPNINLPLYLVGQHTLDSKPIIGGPRVNDRGSDGGACISGGPDAQVTRTNPPQL